MKRLLILLVFGAVAAAGYEFYRRTHIKELTKPEKPVSGTATASPSATASASYYTPQGWCVLLRSIPLRYEAGKVAEILPPQPLKVLRVYDKEIDVVCHQGAYRLQLTDVTTDYAVAVKIAGGDPIVQAMFAKIFYEDLPAVKAATEAYEERARQAEAKRLATLNAANDAANASMAEAMDRAAERRAQGGGTSLDERPYGQTRAMSAPQISFPLTNALSESGPRQQGSTGVDGQGKTQAEARADADVLISRQHYASVSITDVRFEQDSVRWTCRVSFNYTR